MLTLAKQLSGKNILSLRIGKPVGQTSSPIINPNNLKIEGWHAHDNVSKEKLILLSQDIRDILPTGFVVNDHDALTPEHELIRLRSLLDHQFILEGKTVTTEAGKKLGKVTDFALEKNGFFIQKLHVAQSLIKNFSGGMLIIDRSQIIEITDSKIKVKEATVKDSDPVPAIA